MYFIRYLLDLYQKYIYQISIGLYLSEFIMYYELLTQYL